MKDWSNFWLTKLQNLILSCGEKEHIYVVQESTQIKVLLFQFYSEPRCFKVKSIMMQLKRIFLLYHLKNVSGLNSVQINPVLCTITAIQIKHAEGISRRRFHTCTWTMWGDLAISPTLAIYHFRFLYFAYTYCFKCSVTQWNLREFWIMWHSWAAYSFSIINSTSWKMKFV